MRTRRPRRSSTGSPVTWTLIVAVALSPLAVVACGGDGGDSPTAPGGAPLVLASASVLVDGQPVSNGDTFHHRHGAAGGSTLFRAVVERDGVAASGPEVVCRFDLPQGHMHQQHGEFHLYDDGTHGDPVAGDGVYHHEDLDGRYGFHHGGAGHGEYQYEMWGQGPGGGHTNHRVIHVSVAD